MSLHIKQATQRELGIVKELAERIWPTAFAGNLTPAQIDNLLLRIYSLENLHEEMKSGHCFWLARRDKEPVGYASAYKEKDIIWLRKIYILPAEQGSGVGSALLNTVTSAFMPAKEQRLSVNINNLPPQAFYIRKGFTCIEEKRVKMGDHYFMDRVYARALAGA